MAKPIVAFEESDLTEFNSEKAEIPYSVQTKLVKLITMSNKGVYEKFKEAMAIIIRSTGKDEEIVNCGANSEDVDKFEDMD